MKVCYRDHMAIIGDQVVDMLTQNVVWFLC